jgi:pentatricopeptide repeat protein
MLLYFQRMELLKVKPNIVTFTTLLTGFVAKGDYHKVTEYFEKMKNLNITPDAPCFNVVLTVRLFTLEVVDSYRDCAKLNDMKKLLSIMR